MKKKDVVLITLVCSAIGCLTVVGLYSLQAYLAYQRRKKGYDNIDDDTVDVVDGEEELGETGESGETGYLSADSHSSTSYNSLDDDTDFYSTDLLTSSEISIASTFSTDTEISSPFPVGEYSTYKETGDRNTPVTLVEFHEMLNSPVVNDNIVDARMLRSCSPRREIFNSEDDDQYQQNDVELTIQSIVNTYSDIVPPLKPNTGEVIHVPKQE